MYGLGFFESYGYNIGTWINNLNMYGEIKNTFNTNGQVDTFTCLNTPARLFAKIAYPALAIHWRLSQVPGIFPNTDSIINNPTPIRTEVINGRTYYVYTLQQDFTFSQGTVSIPISYTSTVIPNCFQTENAFMKVEVKNGPKADFSISAQQCLSDTVRFTGTTSTQNGLFNYTSYLWDFDDATTQNTVNSKKRFASSGNHAIHYRVYADNGCIGDTVKTVNIINGTGPQISFTIAGKTCVDSTVTFTSAIPPSANTTYYWDFGDNQTVTGTTNTVTHAYTTTATNRAVRHSAFIAGGCSPDTIQQTIASIFANPAAVPFTITGDTLCINKPLQFAATATGVNKWNWDFGNGTGTQTPPFNYSYTVANTYNTKLTVTDINGCGSPSSTNTITIAPNPVVNAGPDKYISVNTSTTLDATLANAANYNLLWVPSTFLNSATILNPVSTPDPNPITYILVAIDKISLCTGTDKVIITPVSKLYIPTAFTPNNDSKNDKWVILGMALYPDAVVTIYNRWGERIFETKNYINNPWTGYYKGQKQPIGSYVYLIQLNDTQKQVLKGTVTIVQ
jgi:gliding motility-associated-like protein